MFLSCSSAKPKPTSDQENLAESDQHLRSTNDLIKIIAYRHSDVPRSCHEDATPIIEIHHSNHQLGDAAAARQRPMRPRFNTLELDLSCTKNKFPITDRRKQIEKALDRTTQTSAPATPTEWSYQAARNGDVHGFLSAAHRVPPSTTASNSQANGPSAAAATSLTTTDTVH